VRRGFRTRDDADNRPRPHLGAYEFDQFNRILGDLVDPGVRVRGLLTQLQDWSTQLGSKHVRIRIVGNRPNVLVRARTALVRGYNIEWARDFSGLLLDTAEFYSSRMVIVSIKGALRQPVSLSGAEWESALAEKLAGHWVSKRHWPVTGIDLTRPERLRHDLSLPDEHRRIGIIELLFQQMALFALAHECGHVALGHCDASNPSSPENESAADQFAAGVLLTQMQHFTGSNESQIFLRVATLTAVTLICDMYQALDDCGEALGFARQKGYPRWSDRFASLKQRFILEGFAEQLFSARCCQLEPPATWEHAFSSLASRTAWQAVADGIANNRKQASSQFYSDVVRSIGHPRP
jgi:hypothetical protein